MAEKIIAAQVPEVLASRVKQAAEVEDRSMSAVIRRCLLAMVGPIPEDELKKGN